MEALILLLRPGATVGVGCKLLMPALATFLIIPTGQMLRYGEPVAAFGV